MNDVPDLLISQAKEAVENIEHSLQNMRSISEANTKLDDVKKEIKRQAIALKYLFILLLMILLGGILGGSITFYHMRMDDNRFKQTTQQIEVLVERNDYVLTHQKDLMEKIVRLHSGENNDSCKN